MEDRINLHQLMELKAAFERADTDQGGSLDMEEFLEAFGGVLGENLTTTQLIHLFMKIDANSDGSVDWDEFTQFMLLENQAAADMSDRSFAVRYMEQDPRLCDPNPKSVHHRDMIEQILLIGKGTQQEKLVTSARDGTVRVWNASTLAHVKTIKVSESSWITDCKYFGASNRLAVACVDRSVYLYDNGSYDEATRVALSGVDTSPLSLGTWNDQQAEKLIVGDDDGHVTLYDCTPSEGELYLSAAPAPAGRRLLRDRRHSDWVTKVCFYDELNAMVSSSLDGTLRIGELERRSRHSRVLGDVEKHSQKKGVYSFDWSNTFKLLASCGLERTVALWNPYTLRQVAQLPGHNSSVQHVEVNDDCHQLITCSIDKTVKVWDLRNLKCLQTMQDKTHSRPENRISALRYDPVRCQLLTASTTLRAWPMQKVTKRSVNSGHEHPLCAALYNQNFNQVVSGDESAQVCVWDVATAEMVFHFADLHRAKMTAMAFDEAGRRLITGGNDGTVRMWNFSNGQCLRELSGEDFLEVSSIMFIVAGQNKLVVAGGWNRKVVVWRDDAEASSAQSTPERTMSGHAEDILSIAFSPHHNVLATSGYDGRILVWHMESGLVKFTLCTPNAESFEVRFESSTPSLPARPARSANAARHAV